MRRRTASRASKGSRDNKVNKGSKGSKVSKEEPRFRPAARVKRAVQKHLSPRKAAPARNPPRRREVASADVGASEPTHTEVLHRADESLRDERGRSSSLLWQSSLPDLATLPSRTFHGRWRLFPKGVQELGPETVGLIHGMHWWISWASFQKQRSLSYL